MRCTHSTPYSPSYKPTAAACGTPHFTGLQVACTHPIFSSACVWKPPGAFMYLLSSWMSTVKPFTRRSCTKALTCNSMQQGVEGLSYAA